MGSSKKREIIIAGGLFLILQNLMQLWGSHYGRKKIVINYPDKDVFVELPLDFLSLQGIQYGLLYNTLLKLEKLSIIKMTYRSKRKIVVEVSDKGRRFFDLLVRISSRTNTQCDITINDAKFLYMVNTLGFLPPITEVARRLSLSKHGAIKLVSKQKELGLINYESGLITHDGQIFLDWLIEILGENLLSESNENKAFSVCNQYGVRGEFLERLRSTIISISRLIRHSIHCGSIKERPKIAIIGISQNHQVMDVIKAISNALRREFTDMLSIAWISDGRRLGISNQKQKSPNRISSILDMISSYGDCDLVILIINIFIAELIGKKISSEPNWKPRVLMVTKIARSIVSTCDIQRTKRRGLELLDSMVRVFKKNNRLGILGDNGSQISINIKKKIPTNILRDAIFLNVPSLERGWCILPHGMLKIHLDMITKHVKVDGTLRVCDEPIYGLKCPGDSWLEDYQKESICEYDLHQSSKTVSIRMKQCKIRYLSKTLPKCVVREISFGLNTVDRPKLHSIFSKEPHLIPYVYGMMTLNIHEEADRSLRRYQHVIRNTEIHTVGGHKVY